MMNYDYYEYVVLACCMMNHKLIERTNESYFTKSATKELFAYIKEYKPESDIDIRSKLNDYYAERSFTPVDLDQLHRSLVLIKDSDAHFNKTIKLLKDRSIGTGILNVLYEAIELVNSGLIPTALNLVKNISYEYTDQVTSALLSLCVIEEDNSLYPSGIAMLDKQNGGVPKSEYMFISGTNGSMKTTVALWMAIKMLQKQSEWKCCFFEKEMSRAAIMNRIYSMITNIPLKTLMLSKKEQRMEYNKMIMDQIAMPEYKEWGSILNRLDIITGDQFDNIIDMYQFIDARKADFFVLDYFTAMGEERDDKMATNDYWAYQGKKLKSLVKSTKTFGLVLGQLKQNTVETHERTLKIGSQSEAEYSSVINQNSAIQFTTFYPSKFFNESTVPKDYFYLINLKNRYGSPNFENGKKFIIPLIAKPNIANMAEPDTVREKAMLDWYSDYTMPGKGNKYGN